MPATLGVCTSPVTGRPAGQRLGQPQPLGSSRGEAGMPAKRELTMRQLRYMLRLHHDGVSARAIGRALGVARSKIQDNLRRAQASGIAWPLPAERTAGVLEQRLFARPDTQAGLRRRSEPDWQALA